MSTRRPPPDPTRINRRTLLGWGGSSALLSACGGGGGGSSSDAPPPPPGPTLPPAERLQALGAVASEYERLCDGTIGASSDAVAAFMRARPEYRRVTVMPDGCVCGEFSDGQIHVVANNQRTGVTRPSTAWQPGASNAAIARRASTHAAREARPAAEGDVPLSGVPSSPAGVSASTFRSYAETDGSSGEVERYERWLRNAGVELLPSWAPTVQNLKDLPELGFFNWLTHGGMLDASGGITHALMTDTVADIEAIVGHLTDLQAGNLVYYTGQYLYSRGKWAVDNFLAITPAFIERYRWRFSANSIVLIHACASDFVGFREAFRAAGAGVYGGWSHPVFVNAAAEAMHWMLDKFVASNLSVPTPDPRNRAHDYEAIKRVGDEAGLTLYDDPSEGGPVSFRFTRLNGNPGTLLPSMVRMGVEENQSRLTLYGSFGDARGKVFVGTTLATDPSGLDNYLPWRPAGTVTELAVLEWSADEVTVELPRTGPGSAGYVAVQVGRRWGNARALTRWNGQMLVRSRGPGTLLLQHTLQFSARCDIGLWRNEPDGPLQDALTAWTATPFEAPSNWTWAATGQHTHTEPGPVTSTVTWSGSHRFELPSPQNPNPPLQQYYSVFGIVDRQQAEFRVAISGGAFGAMPAVQVITMPDSSTRLESNFNIGLPLALSPTPLPAGRPGINRTLAPDFSVPAGEFVATEPTLLPLADPNLNTLTHSITWDAMSAEYPPHRNGGA
ncbi:hypothetical protein [Piscinibacter gummiphilus]|uniref:Uncharacterized protein n=1 Tax=Piscinibacter gummiphilus TaxID=946333 RepID=A0ABZ0CU62_9BURK|nr:hypothetical protein [Piscinibacter gummiphilus]WOB06433.1 hypothetical protein RXV79_16040 [Piscinibacter gummiphilus]